ncbi:MAG: hypothetical protein OXH29_00205 [bacterium]|nr:hypothetical protein [bacterium]
MQNEGYDSQVDDLVSRWQEEIYDGVLASDVLPAITIYAYASLQGMTDEYDVAATFPMLPTDAGLPDHYGNALIARLRGSCTSIRTGLQAIQAHMDCHAAIAAARRAHESLWQMFWLANPEVDANSRIRRLLKLTRQEIGEALRFFAYGINTDVESTLRKYESEIEGVVGKEVYRSKDGRGEYQGYFGPRFNEPLPHDLPPVPADVEAEEIAWSMMSNMTHPNVVFDWVFQIQEDSQDQMDKFQLLPVLAAMNMVSNISTLVMDKAHIQREQVLGVNTTFRQLVSPAQLLLG